MGKGHEEGSSVHVRRERIKGCGENERARRARGSVREGGAMLLHGIERKMGDGKKKKDIRRGRAGGGGGGGGGGGRRGGRGGRRRRAGTGTYDGAGVRADATRRRGPGGVLRSFFFLHFFSG